MLNNEAGTPECYLARGIYHFPSALARLPVQAHQNDDIECFIPAAPQEHAYLVGEKIIGDGVLSSEFYESLAHIENCNTTALHSPLIGDAKKKGVPACTVSHFHIHVCSICTRPGFFLFIATLIRPCLVFEPTKEKFELRRGVANAPLSQSEKFICLWPHNTKIYSRRGNG